MFTFNDKVEIVIEIIHSLIVSYVYTIYCDHLTSPLPSLEPFLPNELFPPSPLVAAMLEGHPFPPHILTDIVS